MDDLTAIINQVLSDPNAMQQLRSMASSLGLSGQSAGNVQAQPPPQAQQNNIGTGSDLSALMGLLGGSAGQQAGNGAIHSAPPGGVAQQNPPDLSALSSLLGNLGQNRSVQAPAQNTMPDLSALSALLGNSTAAAQRSQTPDLSALSALLGNSTAAAQQSQTPDLSALSALLGNSTTAAQQSQTPDLSALSGLIGGLSGNGQSANTSNLSALTSLLNGGNSPSKEPGLFPNIDMSTIMKLSQALSSVQANKANIDLLLALKPRLKEDRAKKVDDAIRVMQLIQFLPLIKESGLFGEMDNILGGLGNLVGASGGGLGGLLGNVGSSIGGLLGNLGLGGSRR